MSLPGGMREHYISVEGGSSECIEYFERCSTEHRSWHTRLTKELKGYETYAYRLLRFSSLIGKKQPTSSTFYFRKTSSGTNICKMCWPNCLKDFRRRAAYKWWVTTILTVEMWPSHAGRCLWPQYWLSAAILKRWRWLGTTGDNHFHSPRPLQRGLSPNSQRQTGDLQKHAFTIKEKHLVVRERQRDWYTWLCL